MNAAKLAMLQSLWKPTEVTNIQKGDRQQTSSTDGERLESPGTVTWPQDSWLTWRKQNKGCRTPSEEVSLETSQPWSLALRSQGFSPFLSSRKAWHPKAYLHVRKEQRLTLSSEANPRQRAVTFLDFSSMLCEVLGWTRNTQGTCQLHILCSQKFTWGIVWVTVLQKEQTLTWPIHSWHRSKVRL